MCSYSHENCSTMRLTIYIHAGLFTFRENESGIEHKWQRQHIKKRIEGALINLLVQQEHFWSKPE